MAQLLKNRLRRPWIRRSRREEGQVLLEFLISFLIFFFLIWSLVIIAMIASTKLLTNYSAWAAARAWSVNVDNGDGMDEAKSAAKDVLSGIRWGGAVSSLLGTGINVQDSSGTYGRKGIIVDYQTTLGIPTFLAGTSSSALKARGFAPMIQETIKASDEAGDNK